MKKPLLGLPAFCLALVALSAAAAPLKRADLPADPKWFLHIDCDALRQGYIGKYLLYQLDKPEFHSNIVAFQSIFNFDLRTQLHGVTVYCDGPAARDNTVIIYADFVPDRLIAMAANAEAAGAFTNNHHVIYGWTEKRRNPADNAAVRNFVAFQGGRVIMSKNRDRVTDSLAVIDGTAPSLSAGKAWPDLADEAGAFVQIKARNLDFLGMDPVSTLIKLSKRARFLTRETDEQFHAMLMLDLGDESTAKQMSAVAQGLFAQLGLQKETPKAAKLSSGMSIKQDGAILTASLSTPASDLIAALKEFSANKDKPKTGIPR